MHIEKRGTRFYWVEWGIDKTGEIFANVITDNEGNDRFARKITRWVKDAFDELTEVHGKVMRGVPFEKVKWTG